MLNSIQIATLLRLPNIGKKTLQKIESKLSNPFDNIRELYDFISEDYSNIEYELLLDTYDKTLEEFENMAKENIYAIGHNENKFPSLLKEIKDPPLILYYKGNIKSLIDYPTVAVIGTRKPTSFGFNMGIRVGEVLTQNQITVVSGLALGCDSAAHLGCVNNKGRTAAFLAHGLHTIYPKANKELANKILDNDGCLITEYAYGIESQRFYFVERDRLQSGASMATVVIETDVTGGTMHTVRFTKEQGRMLYCVDHPAEKLNDKSEGNQMLLKQGGAFPIANKVDIESLITSVKNKYGVVPIACMDIKSLPVEIGQIPEEKSDTIIITHKELKLRLNLKSIKEIDKHIKKGDIKEWARKIDPSLLLLDYNEKEKLFTAMNENTLF